MVAIEIAKNRLDAIIDKARTDLYKPIQIAEVLRQARINKLNIEKQEAYQNPSLRWRNEVTQRLMGKSSSSSARFQHDVWNATAMPADYLAALDAENKVTGGAVERYIYLRYAERQNTVSILIAAVETALPATFELRALLNLFVTIPGIRRSIDKAYEIVTYALFETVVTSLEARVRVSVPAESREVLEEFADLARVLLGLEQGRTEWEQAAHIYRVGVTNAADRGLDMWANFGPAIQVKHLNLNSDAVSSIVDQVETDQIVIVCRDADAKAINTVLRQIGWGRRVRGIVCESDLISWYEKCLRGRFADKLALPLLRHLSNGFKAEFPQSQAVTGFLEERGYLNAPPPEQWRTETDIAMQADSAE